MYRPGRVVLRGYLSGYTPKVGFATCMLGMEDVALRKEINHVIEIAPDGRFEIEVPVDHPSTLSLSIGPRMWDYVYVEPGDTLLCCYDLAEAADPRRADIVAMPASWDMRLLTTLTSACWRIGCRTSRPRTPG